jgi:hypothetical protein
MRITRSIKSGALRSDPPDQRFIARKHRPRCIHSGAGKADTLRSRRRQLGLHAQSVGLCQQQWQECRIVIATVT